GPARPPCRRRRCAVARPSSTTAVRGGPRDADDARLACGDTQRVRELAAAALLLGVLVIAAAAPKLWPSDMDGGALASGRPPAAIASATVAPVSWKGRDGG